LAREAQKQAKDLVADADRPWVGVHASEVVDFEPQKKMGARLVILNSGKTPALKVRTELSIGLIEGIPSQPPDQTFPMPYPGRAVLFPNQTMHMTSPLSTPLSSDLRCGKVDIGTL